MNASILLTPAINISNAIVSLIIVLTITMTIPDVGYAQVTDFDSDGVEDLFDSDTDNDGISNFLEGRCNGTILYNWEEAEDPTGDNDFTWTAVDGYNRDMTITTSHPNTVDNLSTPQTSSGYLEMGMDVSDVEDNTQFTVYELTFSEPTIISNISILDIDSQTGFTFTSYGDGVKVEFFDAYANELAINLVLGQALVQNADGVVVPDQLNVPVAISNQNNWATYSSDELVTTVRITYYSLDLTIFNDPGDQFVYIGDLEFCTPLDSDIDGVPNYKDLDSDNDGIPDAIEACGDINLFLEACSLDANGDAEYLDADLDNISDGLVLDYCLDGPIDSDGDGIADYIDLDSDNDGCADSEEAMTEIYMTNLLDFVFVEVDDTGLLLSGVSGNCPVPTNVQWLDPTIDEECTCDLIGEAIVTPYCNNLPDSGSVEITWTGGTQPFEITGDFTMANLVNSHIFEQLSAGNYNIILKDAEGCESELSFAIEELQGPIIGAIETSIECDATEGQILLNWSSGEGPFTLSGDIMAELIDSPYLIENVTPGDYSLILIDVNGCQSESNVKLEPRYSVEAIVEPICEGTDFYSVIVTAQESIDISSVGFVWSQLNPTSYELTQIPITTSLEAIISPINQDCPTVIPIIPPDCTCTAKAILPAETTITCNDPVVTLDGSASSVGSNYSYNWFDSTGAGIGNTLMIEVSEEGTYSLEVVDNVLDCSTIAQITVIADDNKPVAEIISETTILTCNEPEILLSVNPQENITYQWNIPGQPATTIGETQLVLEVGEVTLTATNISNGCSSTSNLIIEEDREVPPLTILTPQSLNCELSIVILEAINITMSQDLIVQWMDSDSNPITDEGDLVAEVTSAGTYIMGSVNVANGCMNRDSIVVIEQLIYPEVDLIDQAVLTCASPNVTLLPEVNLDVNQYSSRWEYEGDIISNENSINVSNEGIYHLYVVHLETGCETFASTEVIESEGLMEVELSTQNPTCYQSNDGIIDVIDILGGTPPYQYFIDGGNVDLPIGNLSEGSYEVQIIDDEGCEIIVEALLISPPEIFLSADAGSTITVPYGEDVTISLSTNAINISNVDWFPNIDCDDCLLYEVSNVIEDQTYLVNLIDETGCEAEEEIRLIVEYDIKLFLPNILVYGTNDALLYPQSGNPDIYINKFDVYDRWGNQVFQNGGFEPNNPKDGWDSTVEGGPAQAGVYVYHIQYSHPVLGELQIAGNVTLVW